MYLAVKYRHPYTNQTNFNYLFQVSIFSVKEKKVPSHTMNYTVSKFGDKFQRLTSQN